MTQPRLGAQLYTVRQFCKTLPEIAETLKKVADIGYTAIQISGFGPADAHDVAKVVADTGLTVAGTHTAWPRFLNDLNAVIEEHRLWNCPHPAIGGLPQEYRSRQGLDRFLNELVPVAEKLAQAGMTFSYHNHNHELVRFGRKSWLEMLYERADPQHLKAELDTYWIQAGGADPVAWIRRCAGRQPLLHLKDMAITADCQQRFAEIGEGNLNWPDILQAARQSGVEWCLIEQDECYERDPFESLAISYRNLRAMGLS